MPGLAGIGWRHPHYRELLERLPALGFIEVHSENFFADGGAARELLRQARQHYALSLHGVGLSLGSVGPLDDWHLERLARLVDEFEPWLVSDHASFSRGVPRGASTSIHSNDLLPLPVDAAALNTLIDHVDQVQTRLGRRIAVENVSAYLGLSARADPPEVEANFLRELAERSGCLLLVDVNNIVVNATNAQCRGAAIDVVRHCIDWLACIPPQLVAEIHLAGHDGSGDIVIDHHGAPVTHEVWQVYRAAITRFGAVPTLIEWDNHLPGFDVLLAEATLATAACRSACASALSSGSGLGRVEPGVSLQRAAASRPDSAAVQEQSGGDSPDLDSLQRGQAELLAALTACGGAADLSTPVDLATDAGLAVYRHNARGIAARALGAAYPVLRELVGESDFDALAMAHWHDDPPRRGDLAAWGDGLTDWLSTSPVVAAAPYLPDMARLEWALHCAELAADQPVERAADRVVDQAGPELAAGLASSLLLLGEVDPDLLTLVLAPGTTLMSFDWPVAAIWQAHRDHEPDRDNDDGLASPPSQMAQVDAPPLERSSRLADIAGNWLRGEQRVGQVLIWRPRWRAQLREVDAAEAALLRALQGGASLAGALDQAVGLHFGAWLALALQTGLLRGAARR
jgi:uncharacterized protein (UPF0276 family)